MQKLLTLLTGVIFAAAFLLITLLSMPQTAGFWAGISLAFIIYLEMSLFGVQQALSVRRCVRIGCAILAFAGLVALWLYTNNPSPKRFTGKYHLATVAYPTDGLRNGTRRGLR